MSAVNLELVVARNVEFNRDQPCNILSFCTFKGLAKGTSDLTVSGPTNGDPGEIKAVPIVKSKAGDPDF